jgi:flavodoxin I
MGIIYNKIKDSGAKFMGAVETDDYTFDDSAALIDGTFIGLPVDEDNESDLTDGRLAKWVAQIKDQL